MTKGSDPAMSEDKADQAFMRRAIALASSAAEQNEVPVGAVVVCDGAIIAEGANNTIHACDPTGHAEIVALRKAAKRVGNHRLIDASIYITIEPCAMCLGAMVQARLRRIVFGALEPKAGVLQSNTGLLQDACLNHRFLVTGGVLADECGQLMSSFFRRRRQAKAQMKNSYS